MVDEAVLASALQHSPESVSIYALDSTVIYMNPATERAMGVTFEDLRGKRLFEMYPDATETAFGKAFARAVNTGEEQAFEHFYAPFDGWFANRVLRIGDFIHVYARDVTRDVQLRRRVSTLARIADVLTRTELDLRGAAQMITQILSDVLDAEVSLAALSSDGEWLDTLARASRDPEALAVLAPVTRWRASIGNTGVALRERTTVLDVVDRVTGADDAQAREALDRYQPGSLVVAPLLVGDGVMGTVSASRRRTAAPLNIHDRDMVAEVAPSIALYLANTERRTEAALLRNRLSALADSLPMLTSFVDTEERYVYVNRAYETWFGKPREELLGRRLGEMMGASSYAVIEPYVRQVLAGTPVQFQRRYMYPVGERDVDAHYIPVFNDGKVVGFAVVITDITEQVEATKRLASLLDDAQRARADAEAANRSKDEFLAILGHELRNPLAPLVTALELMKMRGDDMFAREHAVIGRQVQHLSRLVDDLLDVSRITQGKVELRREQLPLGEVIAKAVEQTSPLFEERRHHLAIDVPPGLAVSGDATRLAQVFANLLSNAAKYTPPDGRIRVSAEQRGNQVIVRVRDNGIGIGPAMLPRVFELFVQAPQSSERPAGGLGLGLTIVKSLVELHCGTIEVTSPGLGKGSEFSVTLPAAQPAAVATSTASDTDSQRANSARRILVVDDNEDAALMLADLLDAHGHDIRTAFDGPSALRIAEEFHPEVAVLDIGLPVMDGYELAEQLRARPAMHDVRLIAVTGYGQESDRKRSLDAGFQAHLAKPIEIETLVHLVEGR